MLRNGQIFTHVKYTLQQNQVCSPLLWSLKRLIFNVPGIICKFSLFFLRRFINHNSSFSIWFSIKFRFYSEKTTTKSHKKDKCAVFLLNFFATFLSFKIGQGLKWYQLEFCTLKIKSLNDCQRGLHTFFCWWV